MDVDNQFWTDSDSEDDSEDEILLFMSLNMENERPRVHNNNFAVSDRRFDMDSWDDFAFYADFRFTKEDFGTLCQSLHFNGRSVVLENRLKVSYEEALAAVLYRLAYPRRLKTIVKYLDAVWQQLQGLLTS
jgi:hypothetical protein